jgi:hypothetical protein
MDSIASKVAERFRKQAGSTEFSNYVPIPDPKRAYQKACDDAGYEKGHGYSGTIVESTGYSILTRTPMSLDAAYNYADKHEAEKWGPALAIPIGEAKKGTPKKVVVEVVADEEWDVRRLAEDKAREEASKLFPGKNVTVQVIKSERGRMLKPKTKKAPFDGAPQFWWARSKGQGNPNRTFKTRQDAIAFFKELGGEQFKDGEVWTLHEKSIVTAVAISGGASSNWKALVEITPQESVGEIKGWYFYGVASS